MQNIDIHLKSSRIAILGILLLWAGSMVAILNLFGVSWVTLSWVIIVSLYTFNLLYTHGLLLGSKAITGLKHVSGQYWRVIRPKDEFLATLLGDSTVTSSLCVLRFKIADSRYKYSCVLLRDAFEPDKYRQLLLCLRCFRSV